jgi:sulfur relay (sulfurtransferase) DsrF/TusC family protein
MAVVLYQAEQVHQVKATLAEMGVAQVHLLVVAEVVQELLA